MQKRRVKIYNKSDNSLPEYTTEFSACFDLRIQLLRYDEKYTGNGLWTISSIDNHVSLHPGGRILIPTGLFVAIPDGYEIQVRPRSGSAIKFGITILNTPGTIDSDYRGEIGLIVINTDLHASFEIHQGDRLAQGALCEITQAEWEPVNSIEELGDTVRGQGGFGHTGQK